jgi:hypothetical protein
VTIAFEVPAALDARALLVDVPRGLTREADLFDWYARMLSFPGWFGANWNALDECLYDLAGHLDLSVVVLRHAELPALAPEKQATYLGVLQGPGAGCLDTGGRVVEIVAVFPPSLAAEIRDLLNVRDP